VNISGESVTDPLRNVVPPPKKKYLGNKFENDRERASFVTPRRRAQDMDLYQLGIEESRPTI